MSSTDIEVRGGSDLTINPDQRGFTPQQVAALHQIGVENATDGDLAVFFHQAQRTGLDPFARQIYMIGRKSRGRDGQWTTKQTIQTGIDGFRLIARRAADSRGESFSMDDTLWADPDGHWHDLWIWDRPPAAAKVTVHVGASSFSAVAATREYMQTAKDGKPSGQWGRMPAVMIAKCAEALALRKAFPQDLSGIYTGDEMAQADGHTEAQQATAQRGTARVDWSPITEPMKTLGMGKDQVLTVATDLLGREVSTMSGLTQDEVDRIGMALVESKTVDAEVVDEQTGEVQDAFPEPAAPAAGADPWAEGGAK